MVLSYTLPIVKTENGFFKVGGLIAGSCRRRVAAAQRLVQMLIAAKLKILTQTAG